MEMFNDFVKEHFPPADSFPDPHSPEILAKEDLFWEPTYNWTNHARAFFLQYHTFFVIAALSYIPFVFIGQFIMKFRKPFNLDKVWLLWNILMALFSVIGSVKLVPVLIDMFAHYGISGQVCNHFVFTHPAAVWVFYFNVSKVFEWADTLFLILTKRKVIFLHWFHHIMTFLYCWHGSIYAHSSEGTGILFATMNFVVHSIMYSYYAINQLGYDAKSWGGAITFVQTLQMVFGISFIALLAYCPNAWASNRTGIVMCSFMYSVYFYFFFKLLLDKTIFKKPRSSSTSKQDNLKKKDQ